ncbi:hypothetical protein JW824_08870 [bacterium]|nr:hypothetical protein [bacterium]
MVKRLLSFLFLFLFLIQIGAEGVYYQDTTSVEMSVSLSAQVKPNRVPLNRTLTYTIQIIWEGNLDDIEIGDIEEPILSNFDIIGTSSANRVMEGVDGKKAIKEIAYTLQPKTLGMGYVESVALSYKSNQDDKTHYLQTERVAVEVISPVPEGNDMKSIWFFIFACLLLVGGIPIFLFIRRKHLENHEKEETTDRIIEEIYLEELKGSVNLKEKDKGETFSILTRLFRRYLSEKFDISALEATTDELIKILAEENLDESLIRKCEMLLNKADVVKFSGQGASQAELNEAYTTVETILESHLSKSREQSRRMEEESARKRKRWWCFSKKSDAT